MLHLDGQVPIASMGEDEIDLSILFTK